MLRKRKEMKILNLNNLQIFQHFHNNFQFTDPVSLRKVNGGVAWFFRLGAQRRA